MQGKTDTASKHIQCPREVVDPIVLSSSHSVIEELPVKEELPVIGNYEPSLEFSETHESIDTTNIDSDKTETPSTVFLMTGLRFGASTFSVPLVALTALLSILHAFHPELPKDVHSSADARSNNN